jgi:hypothetical protein
MEKYSQTDIAGYIKLVVIHNTLNFTLKTNSGTDAKFCSDYILLCIKTVSW